MTATRDDNGVCELHRLRAGEVRAMARHSRELFHDTTWNAAALEQVLAVPGDFALLAHTSERAAGFVLARAAADECEILWIVVGPSWRRKGLGRRLLRAALCHAAGAGASAAYLEVAETNRAAAALYRAEGFRACGRRAAYYRNAEDGRSDDAILYKKALVPGQRRGRRPPTDRTNTCNSETR